MSHSAVATNSLQNFVAHKIRSLYGSYSAGNSAARKALSDLRRAAGQDPAKNPLAWQYVISGDNENRFPEKYRGQGDNASYGELATYMALTLYAIHQQSQQRMMHVEKFSFGAAVGQLVSRRTPSIKKRFDALLQARTFAGITYHARTLVQLLKQEEIGFDYARFAYDLYLLQQPGKEGREKVITRWSRDFVYGYEPKTSETSEQ